MSRLFQDNKNKTLIYKVPCHTCGEFGLLGLSLLYETFFCEGTPYCPSNYRISRIVHIRGLTELEKYKLLKEDFIKRLKRKDFINH